MHLYDRTPLLLAKRFRCEILPHPVVVVHGVVAAFRAELYPVPPIPHSSTVQYRVLTITS